MRGTGQMKQWELERLAERDATTVTVRCGHCTWTLETTLGEGRDAYTLHRLEHHPEIQPPVRRKRRKLQGQMGVKTLDENIAGVRVQGGHRWDGATT